MLIKKNVYLIEKTHFYIDRITKSLDSFQYNVSVALIREYSNIFFAFEPDTKEKEQLIALKFALTKWVILISPVVPHIAEELWKKIGYKKSLVSEQAWPIADLNYIRKTTINIVIQVNGKKKLVLQVPKDLTAEETKRFLMEKEDLKAIIGSKKIKKTIIIPNKIFSIVVK